MNERHVDYRALASSVGLLGWFAVVMLIVALYIGVRSAIPMASDFFATVDTSGAVEESADAAKNMELFEQASLKDAERFIGRSVFFVPPAPVPPPPPPPPPREPVERTPPPDPGPPPAPSVYGGPKIAFVWNDQVTFENDMTLTVGGEGQSGVEVLSTNLPWSVKLRWREVEFDVQLFERTTQNFLVQPEDDEDQTGDRSGDL